MTRRIMRAKSKDDASLPTVSVVIPAFNAASSVARCVQSILAQDYPASLHEIIVVDNGSTDATEAILRRFNDRIVVLKETRRGAGIARNLGVRRARSEFIAFTDGDCEADPSWVRSLVKAAMSNPAADFMGGPVKVLRATGPIELFAERLFDHRAALQDSHFPYAITGNVLVRRDFLLRLGLFDPWLRLGHDAELSFRALFGHQARFAYTPDAIIYHRNPRNLLALFSEGIKHGRGSAYILERHGGRIGATAFARAFERRRYKRIGMSLYRSLRLSFVSDEAAKGAKRDHFYDAVYNTGKQIGTMAQATKNVLSRWWAPDRMTFDGGRDSPS